MFDVHQKQIGEFARANPDNMRRVYVFVIATIQQSIETVPTMVHDMLQHGTNSKHAWGFKSEALEFINANAESVYSEAMAIYRGHACPDDAAHELLKYFAALPGLGIAKGGFMVQLCFGVSGCLDSHNLKRFNINPNDFKASRYKNAKSPALRSAIIEAYHAAVSNCGGTAGLWNSWCEYVASLRPSMTAYDVSAIHCDALGLAHE
jgi:hypothetical protein